MEETGFELIDCTDENFDHSLLCAEIEKLFDDYSLLQILFLMQEYCENNKDLTFDAQIKRVKQ